MPERDCIHGRDLEERCWRCFIEFWPRLIWGRLRSSALLDSEQFRLTKKENGDMPERMESQRDNDEAVARKVKLSNVAFSHFLQSHTYASGPFQREIIALRTEVADLLARSSPSRDGTVAVEDVMRVACLFASGRQNRSCAECLHLGWSVCEVCKRLLAEFSSASTGDRKE